METRSVPVTKRMVWEAWKRVRANKGSAGTDLVTISKFEEQLGDNLYVIWNRMSSGSYFPSVVKQVEIPKSNGKVRALGIPTVADRTAQMVVKSYLEGRYEQIFSKNSFGYRAGRSAHQALDQCVHNCRRYGWVIDLDIAGFFDNLEHDRMLGLLEKEVPEKWVKLYTGRWLKAGVSVLGAVKEREKGTPQGGVISPLLANIYLHYAFDEWMEKEKGWCGWERYADDIVVHCVNKAVSERMLEEIRMRLSVYGLRVNEEKTRIVCCKPENKGERYEGVSFDFLGYRFKPRRSVNKEGKVFTGYGAGISPQSKKRVTEELRRLRIDHYTQWPIEKIAERLNEKVRGWLHYYTRYGKEAIYYVMHKINRRLVGWVRKKCKVTSKYKALAMLRLKQQRYPKLFAHWQAGYKV